MQYCTFIWSCLIRLVSKTASNLHMKRLLWRHIQAWKAQIFTLLAVSYAFRVVTAASWHIRQIHTQSCVFIFPRVDVASQDITFKWHARTRWPSRHSASSRQSETADSLTLLAGKQFATCLADTDDDSREMIPGSQTQYQPGGQASDMGRVRRDEGARKVERMLPAPV